MTQKVVEETVRSILPSHDTHTEIKSEEPVGNGSPSPIMLVPPDEGSNSSAESNQTNKSDPIICKKERISHTWEETSKDIQISLYIGEGVQQIDVDLETSSSDIAVKLNDGRRWLCSLCGKVKNDETQYSFCNEKITLDLVKLESGATWGELGQVVSSNINKNKMVRLDQVKESHYDKGGKIVLDVFVKSVKNVYLELTDQSVCYCFSTHDEKFLEINKPAKPNTVFYREFKTKYEYNSSSSTYKHSKTKIELHLVKRADQRHVRWTSYEAPSHTTVKPNTITNTIYTTPISSTGSQSLDLTDLESDFNNRPQTVTSGQSTTVTTGGQIGLHSAGDRNISEKSFKDAQNQRVKPTAVVTSLTQTEAYYGLTGLDNLGNTCFMNAIIQVLINTAPLRDFFLNGNFQRDLNDKNPLGSGGRLAVQFALINKILWKGAKSSFAPRKLKELVSMKASQFTGFAQHDAQEFLAFLLDILHEDVNRIKDKQFIEQPDLDQLPFNEAAAETWRLYKLRNDSYIVDKFQGQYKSRLECPEPTCGKVSTTFDPYMYISVPLPKPKFKLPVYLFRRDPHIKPVRYIISVSKECSLSEVKRELSSLCGLIEEDMILFEEYNRKIHQRFTKHSKFNSAMSRDAIFAFERYSRSNVEKSDDVITELYVTQRLLPSRPTECACCDKPADRSGPVLKRCTACNRVGYCNSKCQKEHWSVHKKDCKKTHLQNVGQPFYISLPHSQLTYNKLYELMESYAINSVNTFSPPRTNTLNEDSNQTSVARSVEPFYIEDTSQKLIKSAGDELLEINDDALNMIWRNETPFNNTDQEKYYAVENKTLEYDEDKSSLTVHSRTSPQTCTLDKCLKLFTEPETLAPEEAWYCPQCKTHREARKQMTLWSLPDILIIQLKRFSFRNIPYQAWRDKIDTHVSYPIRGLNMSEYIQGELSPSAPAPVYDLYGVVNHHGGLLGGHYTAFSRCLNADNSTVTDIGWRKFDDDRVYPVNGSPEHVVVNRDAYVLFYRRRTHTNPLPDIIPPEIKPVQTETNPESTANSSEPTGENDGSDGAQSDGERSSDSSRFLTPTEEQPTITDLTQLIGTSLNRRQSGSDIASDCAEPASPMNLSDFSDKDERSGSNSEAESADEGSGGKSVGNYAYQRLSEFDDQPGTPSQNENTENRPHTDYIENRPQSGYTDMEEMD